MSGEYRRLSQPLSKDPSSSGVRGEGSFNFERSRSSQVPLLGVWRRRHSSKSVLSQWKREDEAASEQEGSELTWSAEGGYKCMARTYFDDHICGHLLPSRKNPKTLDGLTALLLVSYPWTCIDTTGEKHTTEMASHETRRPHTAQRTEGENTSTQDLDFQFDSKTKAKNSNRMSFNFSSLATPSGKGLLDSVTRTLTPSRRGTPSSTAFSKRTSGLQYTEKNLSTANTQSSYLTRSLVSPTSAAKTISATLPSHSIEAAGVHSWSDDQ